MLFGALDLDPAVNPAVLDTATWDTDKAWKAVQAIPCDWLALEKAVAAKVDFPPNRGCALYTGSAAIRDNSAFILAGLDDGQQVFLEIGRGDGSHILGPPLGRIALGSGKRVLRLPWGLQVKALQGSSMSDFGLTHLNARRPCVTAFVQYRSGSLLCFEA